MSVGPVPASPVSPVPGLCWAWRYNRCQEKRTYQKKGYFSHDTILLLPRLLPQQRHLCRGYNAAHAMRVARLVINPAAPSVPPRSRPRWREIWISVACRAPSRGRRVALRHRAKAAVDVTITRILQADRIIRVVGLSHRRRGAARQSRSEDHPD